MIPVTMAAAPPYIGGFMKPSKRLRIVLAALGALLMSFSALASKGDDSVLG